jgi:hypothetical protein
MATNTVIGLFWNRGEAECAFDAALADGHEPAHINLVLTDATRTRAFPANRPSDSALAEKVAQGSPDQSGAGVLGGPVGGTVGTIAPVVAAVAAATLIPGLGLVLAGPAAAAVTAAGAVAVAGGLLSLLSDWGIPKDVIERYDAGIRDGGIVIGVNSSSTSDAKDLAQRWRACGAAHVHAA